MIDKYFGFKTITNEQSIVDSLLEHTCIDEQELGLLQTMTSCLFDESCNKIEVYRENLVQIRNDYECTELIAYVNTLNPELNLVATKYESHTLTDNKVKNITIILPNKDSECSKSECGCARTKIFVENNKVPTMYVLVQKKKIIC